MTSHKFVYLPETPPPNTIIMGVGGFNIWILRKHILSKNNCLDKRSTIVPLPRHVGGSISHKGSSRKTCQGDISFPCASHGSQQGTLTCLIADFQDSEDVLMGWDLHGWSSKPIGLTQFSSSAISFFLFLLNPASFAYQSWLMTVLKFRVPVRGNFSHPCQVLNCVSLERSI